MDYEIKRLSEKIKELPGISAKVAEKIALDLVENKVEKTQILKEILHYGEELVIDDLTKLITVPGREPNKNTEKDVLIIVDSNKEVLNLINKTNSSKSKFVLGFSSKKDFHNLDKINGFIARLEKAIKMYKTKEVLFFLSPSIETDIIINVVKEEFIKNGLEKSLKLTKLHIGIPFGGSVEYSDERTMKEAMRNRGKI